MGPPPPSDKAELRAACRRRRAAMPPAQLRAAGAAVVDRLAALLLDGGRPATVGLYAATDGEVDVDALVARLRAAGVVVAYPRITGPGTMAFLAVDAPPVVRRTRPPVREPAADAPVVDELEVVVVPGVAYDREGRRLGFGGGFYDRWLSTRPQVRTVGVCVEALLVDRVPVEPHDVRVDAVVTEVGVYP